MTRSYVDILAAKIARYLLGGFFIFSGIDNFLNLFVTVDRMQMSGALPLLICAASFKIILGLALFFRYHTKYAAVALALYLIIVSLLLYGPTEWKTNELYQFIFIRNVAIVGGLLFVYSHSRGYKQWNEDGWPSKKECTRGMKKYTQSKTPQPK